MYKKLLTACCLVALSVSLVACGGGEPKVSFDELETARRTAKDNSGVNAAVYRADNDYGDGWKLIKRGDSTINNACPQGDGWASITLINEKSGEKIELKCSTVSESIGCIPSGEFSTKSYGQEDGQCNKNVPYPLPKMGS